MREESASVYADILMIRRVKLISLVFTVSPQANVLFSKLLGDSYLQTMLVLQLLITLGIYYWNCFAWTTTILTHYFFP